MVVQYERILELDERYDEIISIATQELRSVTEEEQEELNAIKKELYELDRFGISNTINADWNMDW